MAGIFLTEERQPGQSILHVLSLHKDCRARDGGGVAYFSQYCGRFVCDSCGEHEGIVRCFCGWSESGGDGRRELREMGEEVDDPDEYY